MKVAILGLGYVGLPLCVAVSKKYDTVGYDLNSSLVDNLNRGLDETGTIPENVLSTCAAKLSSDKKSIIGCDIFIVTVPTPVDSENKPDLSALVSATQQVATSIRPGAIVCFESTVYPGTTEEICVPILEEYSKLAFNVDFFVAYSPERMNPGDHLHTVENITKVTSGSTEATAELIDKMYRDILNVSTFKAKSIKVAEASKILENTQRDVNIAFMNEMALFFDKINLKTSDVLAAARTKWNFLDFKPGLVGGHCISVDPYYLISKAESVNVALDLVKTSRKVNEFTPIVIAEKVVQFIRARYTDLADCDVLILGLAFKENVKDIRNSKVINMAHELNNLGLRVSIFDPVVGIDEVIEDTSIQIVSKFPVDRKFHAAVAAVAHDDIKSLHFDQIKQIMHVEPILIDLKEIWPSQNVTYRL